MTRSPIELSWTAKKKEKEEETKEEKNSCGQAVTLIEGSTRDPRGPKKNIQSC